VIEPVDYVHLARKIQLEERQFSDQFQAVVEIAKYEVLDGESYNEPILLTVEHLMTSIHLQTKVG
jgi:hypothetical protein